MATVLGRNSRKAVSSLLFGFALLTAHTSCAEPPVLALRSLKDGPQEYSGTPYYWLAEWSLEVELPQKLEPGDALELLWGAKRDVRAAEIAINGKSQVVTHGGYDGFQWFRLPLATLPAKLTLRAHGADKVAFVAGARVVGAARAGVVADQLIVRPLRIASATIATPAAPPFPEMAELWETPVPLPSAADQAGLPWQLAERNARQAAEMLFRCRKFVDGWLAEADPETGLIPRNLARDRDIWNAQDAAADNYPFMVLTAALTDQQLFQGTMRQMLGTETELTSRLGRLPDTWSFSKQGFASDQLNLDAVLFGASEYCKDGLMPLTEWLGPSPWTDRMVGMVDDIFQHANVETPYGTIPTTNVEVHGELLQVLSRLYWMTGDEKYLDWAVRIGDYYLFGGHHPTDELAELRLIDHGCEITDGLAELYATLSFARPEKKREYYAPIHRMYDRILDVGRDPLGMLYVSIQPKTGQHSNQICDTWGYNYYGIYTVYLIDKTQRYRDAVCHVLSHLDQMARHDWGGADAFADSIEGAINLYAREPYQETAQYIDAQIPLMWRNQKADGIVEGWHGDGNSARTAIMYALWKTQGITITNWRSDVRFGAVERDGTLGVLVAASEPWEGKLIFDRPRHREYLNLPIDYTRINQFPEWYTVEVSGTYHVSQIGGASVELSGQQLRDGMPLRVPAAEKPVWLTVRKVPL